MGRWPSHGLLGQSFRFFSNHTPLQWLHRIEDAIVQITHWYLVSQPFKFEIVQWLGEWMGGGMWQGWCGLARSTRGSGSQSLLAFSHNFVRVAIWLSANYILHGWEMSPMSVTYSTDWAGPCCIWRIELDSISTALNMKCLGMLNSWYQECPCKLTDEGTFVSEGSGVIAENTSNLEQVSEISALCCFIWRQKVI